LSAAIVLHPAEGPNIVQVVEFFTEVLDFSPTEAAETPDGIAAAFLSCSVPGMDYAGFKASFAALAR